jgi:hypothetical protein
MALNFVFPDWHGHSALLDGRWRREQRDSAGFCCMIGQSRTALGLLFTLPALILSGCNRPHGVSIDQCSNPKLLRAKVSDTVFDFPNSVGFLHGSLYSNEDELEKIGIVDIRYPEYEKNPEYRSDCNHKSMPVGDFKTDVRFIFKGDGTEPQEYRLGNEMSSITAIRKYEPDSKSIFHSKYLADVDDIEKVVFLGVKDIPPVKNVFGNWSIFEFGFKDRRMSMECAWTSAKAPYGEYKATPPFPYLCDDMTFRSGDLLISVGQESIRGLPGEDQQLIPPGEWPKQWAYTIRKILSYRVDVGNYGDRKLR